MLIFDKVLENQEREVRVCTSQNASKSHYLNQWWLVSCRIYASLSLNESTFLLPYDEDINKRQPQYQIYTMCEGVNILVMR